MPKPPFPNVEFWLRILARLEELPADQLSTQAVEKIKQFRKTNPTEVDVWNFLKQLLEFVVQTDGGNTLVRTTLDVEPHYEPPK